MGYSSDCVLVRVYLLAVTPSMEQRLAELGVSPQRIVQARQEARKPIDERTKREVFRDARRLVCRADRLLERLNVPSISRARVRGRAPSPGRRRTTASGCSRDGPGDLDEPPEGWRNTADDEPVAFLDDEEAWPR